MSNKISERTLPLQGLRVLLMLGIVMLHTYHKPILGTGRECVSFFIIVSGFLYRDALPWKQYMRKKAIGIFPVFWIVLMLSEVICLLRGGNNIDWSIIPHILLLQSWYPNLYFSFDYVGVAWFVSSLMFCYVVSPMLYRRVKTMGMKSSFLCMASLFVCLVAADSFRVPIEDSRYAFREWLCYANPLYCLMEYMIGMLLWKVSEAVSCCRLNAFYEPVAACLIAGYVYAIWVNVGGYLRSAYSDDFSYL